MKAVEPELAAQKLHVTLLVQQVGRVAGSRKEEQIPNVLFLGGAHSMWRFHTGGAFMRGFRSRSGTGS